jgi:uncharacterized protein (DUF58 family)
MSFNRVRAFLRWFYNYRSIRLTPDGTRFVVLSLAVGVAAINTGNNLLYLLLAMMLSLIVISGILSEQCLKELDIRRRLPEHVFANRSTTAALIIRNRKRRFPTFSLRVMDIDGMLPVDRGIHLLHLPARGTALKAYPLLVGRRGLYRLDGVKLLTPFPFGLFMKAASLPLPCEIVVYPELTPLTDLLTRDLITPGHEQPIPQRGHGAALYNLRDYHTGDDSRAIHWKTSARQGRLTVKETEAEDLHRVTIILPTVLPRETPNHPEGRSFYEQRFERAISLAASLVTFFEGRGYAIRLILEEREVPYGSGPAHYYRLLRELALCVCSNAGHDGSLSETFGGRVRLVGGLTLLVMPWEDARLAGLTTTVSRIITVDRARNGQSTMTSVCGAKA